MNVTMQHEQLVKLWLNACVHYNVCCQHDHLGLWCTLILSVGHMAYKTVVYLLLQKHSLHDNEVNMMLVLEHSLHSTGHAKTGPYSCLTCLSACLSVCQSVCLPACLPVCLSV